MPKFAAAPAGGLPHVSAPKLTPLARLHRQGAPLGRDFGQFIESAGVEVLGLVPSIVKAWRSRWGGGCVDEVIGLNAQSQKHT